MSFQILLFATSMPLIANSQQMSNHSDARDDFFMYEVKTIDEFIERFNDDPNSLIRKELAKRQGANRLTHREILISLFNFRNNWQKDSGAVNGFCTNVLDADHPSALVFEDSNWYAEAQCVFLHEKKRTEIPVFLHLEGNRNDGFKWMIVGLGDNFLLGDTSHVISKEFTEVKEIRIINPSGFATNFAELYNVFHSAGDVSYFFEPQILGKARTQQLIKLTGDDKMTFQCVRGVKYHFFGIENWVFTVEHFDRKDLNSGWLINSLEEANEEKKLRIRKQMLHL